MSLGDITIYDDGTMMPGAKTFPVHASQNANSIKAGELVLKAQGNAAGAGRFVTRWTVSSAAKPSVGTDFIAGLAASTSTDTATTNGTVDVWPNLPGMTYLGTPNASTSWDTQAEYDALIGARVLLNCSSTGVQTVLASDHANSNTQFLAGGANGLVVEPLDISKYPGKVRFSLKQSLNYNNL